MRGAAADPRRSAGCGERPARHQEGDRGDPGDQVEIFGQQGPVVAGRQEDPQAARRDRDEQGGASEPILSCRAVLHDHLSYSPSTLTIQQELPSDIGRLGSRRIGQMGSRHPSQLDRRIIAI